MGETIMSQQSAFGFRNCRPVGREERKAANDKESIEKQRLRERREDYFHFEEPIPRADGGVSASAPGTVGWVPESDRFANDVAGQEKAEQQARRRTEENFWDARRDANVHREEKRWEKMEQQEQHQMAIDANCAESRSRKNAGSIPYDMITLRYHDTDEGGALLQSDQQAKERQVARSQTMYDNANRTGYNPVTGDVNPYGALGRG